MRTVHKYEVDVTDGPQTYEVHSGYHIIHFGEQNGKLCMWVDHRTECEKVSAILTVVGTGHDISDFPHIHLGTVQMSSGLVWHIYNNF